MTCTCRFLILFFLLFVCRVFSIDRCCVCVCVPCEHSSIIDESRQRKFVLFYRNERANKREHDERVAKSAVTWSQRFSKWKKDRNKKYRK